MKVSLGIFAKTPQPGQTKTRLIPLLGEEGAAAAHRQLVAQCLMGIEPLHATPPVALGGEHPTWQPQLWVTEHSQETFQWSEGWSLPVHLQCGADLGERMFHGLAQMLEEGADLALLIGSDCPGIDADYLTSAVVRGGTADLLLGPAEDGGYGLIGLRQPMPEIFKNIAWGTDQVLDQTLSRARALGLSVALMETVWDVDTPDDWSRYLRWRERSR
tara:strand:- start:4317 stop:4964 length:648 start_codon:yes stop_codon:yes gene_type:complete